MYEGVTVSMIFMAAVQEAQAESSIPPAAIALLAFTVLMSLLFVTYAFRSVGTRHQGE